MQTIVIVDAEELSQSFSEEQLLGQSEKFLALKRSILEVSASSANVLIRGESGTGKEVAAKAIHYNSQRGKGPFIALNCAALPEPVLESELFGHVKGAFTGANANRTGRFAQADGGTILLDEIGDMPLSLQAKILRCIQEKTIEPIGSSEPKKVDVRILAATNQNLEASIAAGSFRQDLFYRLNVYPLAVPPLRERVEDIPLLAGHFAAKFAARMGKGRISFTPEALQVMRYYAWPGNIRELENCIERLNIIAGGSSITPEHLAACALPAALVTPSAPGALEPAAVYLAEQARLPLPKSGPMSLAGRTGHPGFPMDLVAQLEAIEREFILQALKEVGGVQVKAAELLGVSERSIWHRIKKLGIQVTKEIT